VWGSGRAGASEDVNTVVRFYLHRVECKVGVGEW